MINFTAQVILCLVCSVSCCHVPELVTEIDVIRNLLALVLARVCVCGVSLV